ncbi:hypothetical protein M9Y10_045101 [Tritrichomonas musculus]|uniref:Uncharacterized protein n=1 Tax=Tritrichomonas musculus TaxID=1915356 RepID=A0ABR2JUP1_9EUKA
MSNSSQKKRGSYQKHKISSNSSAISPITPDGASPKPDRKLMSNFLAPFNIALSKYSVRTHKFASLFKKYKVSREEQQKILKLQESQIKIDEVITSRRELNHSNSDEKDILFTYQAASDPSGSIAFLYDYILNKLPNISNKMNLINELICEIKEIMKERKDYRILSSNTMNPPEQPPSCSSSISNSSSSSASQSPPFVPLSQGFEASNEQAEILKEFPIQGNEDDSAISFFTNEDETMAFDDDEFGLIPTFNDDIGHSFSNFSDALSQNFM